MRTKMLAACVFAAICLALISCNWFGKKKTVTRLAGKWKITAITDSSIGGLRGKSIFADVTRDTAIGFINFISDSTVSFISVKDSTEKDTALYHVDTALHSISVRGLQDEKEQHYAIRQMDDTLLHVMLDSIYITLHKQP